MADNVPAKDGNGGSYSVRAEDIGGQHLYVFLAGSHERTYKGVQNLTLSGTATSLTVPGGATHADIYAEGGTVNDFARYWHFSTNPTSTVGKRLRDHEEIVSANPLTFRAIVGSGAVTLRIEYYSYE
jgi:hypothetical protein